MANILPEDIQSAISILKKVEKYEKSNEYTRLLFIVAIVGIIAIFEGFLAYIIEKYVGTNLTLIFLGDNFKDPILFIGLWITQIAIFSSIIVYSRTNKGLMDIWTPYLEKLAVLWAIAYIGSFLTNVLLLLLHLEQYGPSIWAIFIGFAFLLSAMIIYPLEETQNVRMGLYFLTIINWLLSLILPFINEIYRMLILGMILGSLLLLLAGILHWKAK